MGAKPLMKVSAITLGILAVIGSLAVALTRPGFLFSPQQQRPRRAMESGSPADIVLKAGSDLNAALKKAQPGDTIILEAGAVFKGPITLPVKSGEKYITVRSSAPAGSLPGEGERVTPAYAGKMPKIMAPGDGQAALKTAPGAHHFRFIGVEFKPSNSSALVYDLIQLGEGSSPQNTLDVVPHHLIFDRCYIHGDSAGTLKRGVALNSRETEIVNSYVSECKLKGQDSQALCGWNGPGPFKIINNYLEGAGENVMFGGADPSIPGLVPSDIEIRRNHFYKPLAWRGQWTVKNLFELKNAQRVIVDGNLMEHSWADGQMGYAVVLTPRNQEGTAPWSLVRDVEFTNNIVRHVASGISIMGQDDIRASGLMKNILIHNNLAYDVTRARWGGLGFGVIFNHGGGEEIRITHNTLITDWCGIQFEVSTQKINGLTVLNNIMEHICGGPYSGTEALNWAVERWDVRRNVMVGTYPQQPHPAGNLFAPTAAGFDVLGFVNAAAGDYRLAERSPYKKLGTDGRPIGCDFEFLGAAQSAAK